MKCIVLSIPLPCGSPIYLRKVIGFFSDAGDMEEDEMEDLMEAAVELKPRVSLTCVGLAQINPCYLVDPYLKVDLNEDCFSVFFSIFPKLFREKL